MPGRRDAQLGEDARDVLLDRPQRDHHRVGDPLVRVPGGHELEHLPLAGRERGERVVASSLRDQPRHDERVERRAAVGDPPHRRDELLDVADPVLQQVADARRRSRPSSFSASPSSRYCDSTSTPTVGCSARISSAALQALVGVGRRQADVDDRDVGRARAHHRQQVVGRLATCRPPRTRCRRAVARALRASSTLSSAITTRMGSPLCTRVPPPDGVQTRSRPPSASTRSASPRSPDAAFGVGAADAVVDDLDDDRADAGVGSRGSRVISTVADVACGVLADVRDALAHHVVRGDLDRLGQSAVELDRQVPTGTGACAASSSSATASPCALTTAGWMPRATSRSSASDTAICPRASIEAALRRRVARRSVPRVARGRVTARPGAAARRREDFVPGVGAPC